MAFAVRPVMHPRYANLRQIAGQAVSDGSTSDTSQAAQGNAGQVQSAAWGSILITPPAFYPLWIAGQLATGTDTLFSGESSAQARRDDLAIVAKNLDTVIQTCPKVPAVDRTNWSTFTQAFIVWYNSSPSATDFNDGADKSQAASYQTQLRNWQIEISKYCNIGMPLLPAPNPSLSQLGNKALDVAQSYFDTVKTVTIVSVIGIAALLIFSPRARALAASAL